MRRDFGHYFNHVCLYFLGMLLLSAAPSFSLGVDVLKGIEIHDTNRNGKIDRAVIWFDTEVDSSTVMITSKDTFAVSGYSVYSIGINLDNNGDGICDGYKALSVFFYEGQEYDTGVKPNVTYYGNTLKYKTGATVSQISDVSAVEVDKAAPIILRGTTKDIDNNGLFDEWWLLFSEPVHDAVVDGFWMIEDAYAFQTNSHYTDGNFLILRVIEKELPYGTVPRLSYASVSSGQSSVPPSSGNHGKGAIRDYAANGVGAPAPNYFFINAQNSGYEEVPPDSLHNEKIRLIAPNWGEKWHAGGTYNISWISHDIVNLKIEYSIDGCDSLAEWKLIKSPVNASLGKYSWLVPETPSTNCYVRLTDTVYPSEYKQSYAPFVISYPDIYVHPNPLVFTDTPLGTSQSQWLTIDNPGSDSLYVSSITSSLPDFTVSPSSVAIDDGKSVNVAVTFRPSQPGDRSGTFSIYNSVTSKSPYMVNVRGKSIDPVPSVSPDSLNFGDIRIGASADTVMVIRNEGTGDLVVERISSDLPYLSFNPTEATIPEGGHQDVIVTFTPNQERTYTGTITIQSIARTDSLLLVPVLGRGVTPEIDTVPTRGNRVNIGNVIVGESGIGYFTVSNLGTYKLTVNNIVSDNQVFTLDKTSFFIPPHDSSRVTVMFSPVSAGYKHANITVFSDDDNEPSVTVEFEATGVVVDISLEPSPLDMGTINYGVVSSMAFKIMNKGSNDIQVKSITSNNAAFTSDRTSPFTIPKSDSALVTVTIKPVAVGPDSAQLSIETEYGKLIEGVYAVIVGSDIVISPLPLDFGEVEIGDSVMVYLPVKNIGTADLIVSSMTGGKEITCNPKTLSVPPDSTGMAAVTFTPTTIGSQPGTLTVTCNDPETPKVNITLIGLGVSPKVTVEPVSLDYNEIEVGDTGKKIITLNNNGKVNPVTSTITSSNPAFIVSPSSVKIGSGLSTTVEIAFTPVAAGENQRATITVTNNGLTAAPLTVSAKGNGIPPIVTASPDSIDFGEVEIGNNKTLSYILTNEGKIDPVVMTISSGNPSFRAVPSEVSLGRNGGSKPVTVIFTPAGTGDDSTVITSENKNFTDQKLTVIAKGRGVTPDITVTPLSINFGDVAVNDTSYKSLTIKNDGTAELVVYSIGIKGTDSNLFNNDIASATLVPGDSVVVTFIFVPGLNTGSKSVTISVESNDLDEKVVEIPVSARCITPDINLPLTTFDFDDVEVIRVSLSTTFSIENKGDGDLIIKNISSNNNDFTWVIASSTIAAGGSEPLKITFTPSRKDTSSAVISIESNDPDEKFTYIHVSGNGITPEISVDPASLNIGDVEVVRGIGTKTFTIKNIGTSTLAVDNITTDNTAFKVDTEKVTLLPGASKTVTVTFSPTVKGDQQCSVTIGSNDLTHDTVLVPVRGKGTKPDILIVTALSPPKIDIGQINKGETGTGHFFIKNNGDSELTVYSVTSNDSVFIVDKNIFSGKNSISIVPGDSIRVDFTFRSDQRGSNTALITVTCNDLDEETVTIVVSAHVVAPMIEVTPAAIDFGKVPVNTTVSDSLVIKNVGDAELDISGIAVDDPFFTLSLTRAVLPSKNDSVVVYVSCRPARREEHNASITINSNALGSEIITTPVKCKSIGPVLSLSDTSITFDKPVLVGSTDTRSFSIANTGDDDLRVTSIRSDKPDFIVSSEAVSLAQGKSAIITVTFKPSDIGKQDAVITLTNNTSDAFVSVSGTGFRYCRVTELKDSMGGVHQSDIKIEYNVEEMDNLPVDLIVRYVVKGDTLNATIKESLKGIVSPYKGSFTWEGDKDFGGSFGYEGPITLIVTPDNGVRGKLLSLSLSVNYNKLPVTEFVSLPEADSGIIDLRLKVSDVENDSVKAVFEYYLDDDSNSIKQATVSRYSLDGGNTFNNLSGKELLISQPNKTGNIIISWDTMKDVGYIYNRQAHFIVKSSDKHEGNPALSMPFLVTNLVGDYNHNLAIDLGDYALFIAAWGQNQNSVMDIGPIKDSKNGLGPVKDASPELIIDHDNTIDFEDLMVFAWMYQWYVVNVKDQTAAKMVYRGEQAWDGIYIVQDQPGVYSVMCDMNVDTFGILLDCGKCKTDGITISGGRYWKNNENSFMISRTLNDGSLEWAAAQFKTGSGDTYNGPNELAVLRLSDNDNSKNTILEYCIRIPGSSESKTGKIALSEIVLSEKPVDYTLFQNSPNPFNPSTTLSYEIPTETHVRLTIYNITGQVVKVLMDDNEKAGRFSVVWEAGDMPSGIYFYTLEVGNTYTETRKMLLMK
ncbi:choice-of-anchor D domain-containing protein [bacterium]|nr:choice-of-anchor D domain-containing protein [bacterium]